MTSNFSWPEARRVAVRRELDAIPVQLRWQPSNFLDYETHHPPLVTFCWLCPSACWIDAASVTGRNFANPGSGERGAASVQRCRAVFLQLAIPDPYQSVGLFCLLSSQMIWATLAHVGNDWLAVPIAIWMLVAMNRFDAMPSRRTAAVAAIVLAAGLLTKAYFLAFVPLLIAVCVVRSAGGISRLHPRFFALSPAMVRPNFVLYACSPARRNRERASAWRMFCALRRPSLGRCNLVEHPQRALDRQQHFLDVFSRHTDVIIAVSCLALILWQRESTPARNGSLSLLRVVPSRAQLLLRRQLYLYQGRGEWPSPWYPQPLVAPLLGLALLGRLVGDASAGW